MNKERRYFSNGQKLFWILLLVLVVFSFLHLADKMFKSDGIAEAIVKLEKPEEQIAIDTSSVKDTTQSNCEMVPQTWTWQDYNGNSHSINFKLCKDDYKKSTKNRIKINPEYSMDQWSALSGVYWNMYQNDRTFIKNIVNAYKNEIKKAGITGYKECLDFVVSSIQTLGYTYVCMGTANSRCGVKDATPEEDCRPPKTGFLRDDLGCCDNVIPSAVYSPMEFAYQRTGDCDTKALFAYTVLKEMGFTNVAVLVGNTDGGGHSMLGVKIPNPSKNKLYVTDNDGSKYYAWEVTSGNYKLGQECWQTWTDWKISIK
jgi:hypothetical protein